MSSGDRDLMAYHDGELTPEEARSVAARLERDAGARARLRGIDQVGDWVRLWAEEKSRGFDVSEQVMARVTRPRAKPAAALGRWLPAAATTLALAATVALLVTSRRPAEHAAVPRGPVSLLPSAPPTPPIAAVAAPVPEHSVAIESVDFGEHQGAIFMVGGSQGETPVIWLADQPPDRRRIPPL